MALLLPQYPEDQNKSHPIEMQGNRYYSYRDITGKTVTINCITQKLCKLNRSDVLRTLSSLGKLISSNNGLAAPQQLQLSKVILEDSLFKKVEEIFKRDSKDPGVIFHRASLWLIIQFSALMSTEQESDATNTEVANAIGEACIMANDILIDISSKYESSMPQDNPTEWMISLLVPLHKSGIITMNPVILPRTYFYWVDILNNSVIKRRLKELELDSSLGFEATYGFELIRFLEFLTIVYIRFVAHHFQHSLNPILFDLNDVALTNIVNEEEAKDAISLIAQTPDDLSIRMLQHRHLWSFDITPLSDKPLLEIRERNYCCPDITLLICFFNDEVMRLLEVSSGKDKFRQLLGYIFEEYINLVSSTFLITTGPTRTYFASPVFRDSKDQVCDSMILCENSYALIEIKAGRLTSRQRSGGSTEEIIKGIETIADHSGRKRKGVPQLANSIARIYSNNESIQSLNDQITIDKSKTIFPIIICLEESFCFHATQKLLQKKFELYLSASEIAAATIKPIILLSVSQYEDLAVACRRISLEKILYHYVHHLKLQEKDYTGTFHGFLRHHYGNEIEWDKSFLMTKHKEIFQLIAAKTDPNHSPTETQ